MKNCILLAIALLSIVHTYAQTITGDWYGVIKVQNKQVRIILHISEADSGYIGAMDSPDQNANGMIFSNVDFKNGGLTFTIAEQLISYQGILGKDNTITGIFKQRGRSVDLDFSRKRIETDAKPRPQEPLKPYSYYSEDLRFENTKDNIMLAGTLTLPKGDGPHPVVILISGSGPQNRDSELAGHKPFLVLADHLTRNGIAVFRYDDRGTAESKGRFSAATSADLANDVEAAIQYLKTRKEINKKKIGLVGHSEGGIIAPMVAVKNKDVNYLVLLAGIGIPIDQMLIQQTEMLGKASGITDENLQGVLATTQGAYEIVQTTEPAKLKETVTKYFNDLIKSNLDSGAAPTPQDEEFIQIQVGNLTDPWFQYFVKYNPIPVLEKVKCPVLALNGSMDKQIASAHNLKSIKAAIEKGGNRNVTIKELPYLNHLFQECETGAPSEYGTIEQTISPIALHEVSSWILKQVR